MEDEEKERAKERQAATQFGGNGAGQMTGTGETRDIIAKKAGFGSSMTMRRDNHPQFLWKTMWINPADSSGTMLLRGWPLFRLLLVEPKRLIRLHNLRPRLIYQTHGWFVIRFIHQPIQDRAGLIWRKVHQQRSAYPPLGLRHLNQI